MGDTQTNVAQTAIDRLWREVMPLDSRKDPHRVMPNDLILLHQEGGYGARVLLRYHDRGTAVVIESQVGTMEVGTTFPIDPARVRPASSGVRSDIKWEMTF
jgi:hypothetical protein